MSKKLIIVESPNKIKKIKECVGKDFEVLASVGHIMDLEKKKLGFDLETFEPRYVVSEDKKDVVKKLKAAASDAEEIYVCTDADREGENIAYNILSIVEQKNKKIYRAIFKELTKKDIMSGLKNPIGFNEQKNQAQQARRITDRLVGFKVSPMLWFRGGMKGVSAGRVQSAALKMIVEREREIRAFKKEEYWSVQAKFDNGLVAELSSVNNNKARLSTEPEVDNLLSDLKKSNFQVIEYKNRKRTREPYPPFITSTLQMEASSKYGWSSKRTMDAAQSLFGSGLITYHRTDSERIEPDKLNHVRDLIKNKFGEEYLSESPRQFLAKDSSQDAHECIRPTFEDEPASLGLDEKKLLRLIENRFFASQMANAEYDQAAVKISGKSGDTYELKASGSVLTFDGFIKVYGSDAKDNLLPKISNGDTLSLSDLLKNQHFTKPPARFNDASMVALLESEGIGRPSTFASIPETLLDRGYIERESKNSFRATELGVMVSDYLVSHFPDLVNAKFTANMEMNLDLIANGKAVKNDILQEFLNKLLADIEMAKNSGSDEFLKTGINCKKCDGQMLKKASDRTVFLGCSNHPQCGYTLNYGNDGELIEKEVETGLPCPDCGNVLLKKNGAYGAYFSCSSGKDICSFTASVGEDGNPVRKVKAQATEHKCPNCKEGYFVRRTGKQKDFYGCNKFPKCKTIMNIGDDGNPVQTKTSKSGATKKYEETGKDCPKCKTGKVVIKSSKFGKFLSCTEYSSGCKYTGKIEK